jgi:hypothetical protein
MLHKPFLPGMLEFTVILPFLFYLRSRSGRNGRAHVPLPHLQEISITFSVAYAALGDVRLEMTLAERQRVGEVRNALLETASHAFSRACSGQEISDRVVSLMQKQYDRMPKRRSWDGYRILVGRSYAAAQQSLSERLF